MVGARADGNAWRLRQGGAPGARVSAAIAAAVIVAILAAAFAYGSLHPVDLDQLGIPDWSKVIQGR